MAKKPREKQGPTLGWQIRCARGNKGWSQAQFAKRIGVTKTYISILENDRQDPSLELLRTIWRVTGQTFGIEIGAALDERAEKEQ